MLCTLEIGTLLYNVLISGNIKPEKVTLLHCLIKDHQLVLIFFVNDMFCCAFLFCFVLFFFFFSFGGGGGGRRGGVRGGSEADVKGLVHRKQLSN